MLVAILMYAECTWSDVLVAIRMYAECTWSDVLVAMDVL